MPIRSFRYVALLALAVCALLITACSQLAPGGGAVARSVSATPAALLSRDTSPRPASTATRPAGPRQPLLEAPSPLPTTQPPPAPMPTLLPTETAAAALPPYFEICSPLDGVALEKLSLLISDPYRPPPKGSDERHPGVDFAYYHWKEHGKIDGSLLHSVMSGWVAVSLENTFPYGSFVIIETPPELLPERLTAALEIPAGQSLYLLYAHMKADSLAVKLGEPVEPCQVIGAVGSTGNSGAPHLHLETRTGPPGQSFDRMSYYTETATRQEKQNYRRWSVSGEFVHFDPMRLIQYWIDYLALPIVATETASE